MAQYSIPLYSYKQFMEWSCLCQEEMYKYNPKSTFGSVLKQLTKYKSVSNNIPRSIEAKVDEAHPFIIQLFPFIKNVQRLLLDSNIMDKSVWRYDPSSNYYDEINTGQWWANAELNMFQRLCQSGISNHQNHYICPVILFIDSTHCDRNGRLTAEPVLCSIGNISLLNRKNPKSWFFLGLLPMKQESTPERASRNKGAGLRSQNLKLYHECLHIILKEFLESQDMLRDNKSGICMEVHSKRLVKLHFELCFVIVDTAGYDVLCCHSMSYSKRTTLQFVNSQEIYTVVENCISCILRRENVGQMRERAKNISQKLQLPVFQYCYFGGDKNGIFGATPLSITHFTSGNNEIYTPVTLQLSVTTIL